MATWKIDPMHSEIQFKVKHLMISNVTGSFGMFEAQIESENDTFENANINFSAQTNSISTGNEQRDTHLKSADFFESEVYPQLTFSSTSFEKKGEDIYELKGELTIKDVTKPVVLQVELGGEMVDPYGQQKVGFDIQGVIKRKEFGLTWDAVTEAGGVVVSDDVKLIMNVQFVKQ